MFHFFIAHYWLQAHSGEQAMDALAPLELLFPTSLWVGVHIALAHYSMRDLGTCPCGCYRCCYRHCYRSCVVPVMGYIIGRLNPPNLGYMINRNPTPTPTLVLTDAAQDCFESVRESDPHRMQFVDTYSNILYVKERRVELSHLAHMTSKVRLYSITCIVHLPSFARSVGTPWVFRETFP